MATVYSVDVNVNLLNGGSLGGSGGSGGVRELSSQLDDVDRKSQNIAGTWSKLFVSREIERFGEKGVDAFQSINKHAADLQEAMMNVRLGLNLTAVETGNLQSKFFDLDQTHKTSALDMAHTALILQESGIRSQAQMIQLMEPGQGREGLLTFQDVMMSRANPMDAASSARLGMQFIDTAGVEGPDAQANMLDLVTRALKSDPQAGGRGLLNAFQNIHRTGDFAGLGLEQQMQLAAMTTMSGQSGRESQQIANLVAGMELTGHKGTKQAEHRAASLREMGVMGASGDPLGDVFAVLETIAKLPKGRARTKHLIATAFPNERQQQEVLELTQPGKQQQLKGIVDHWKELSSTAVQHNLLMTSVNSQLAVLHSNLGDVQALMSPQKTLEGREHLLEQLNSFAGWVKKFEADHPTVAGGVGTAIGVGGGVIEGGAKIAQIALMAKMVGGGGMVTGLISSVGAIAAAVAPIALGIVGVGAIVDAVGEYVIRHRGGGAPQLGATGQDVLAHLTPEQRKEWDAKHGGAGGTAVTAQDHLRAAANIMDHSDKHHITKHLRGAASNTRGLWQGTGPNLSPTTGAGSR